MRYTFCILLSFLFFSIKANAQRNYFVYIESANGEPFYVMLDGKTNYSSSAKGYLTIAQLPMGSYQADIGFVGNKYPEQHFLLNVDTTDKGFQLRQLHDTVFGLLNLQTYKTLIPIKAFGLSPLEQLNKLQQEFNQKALTIDPIKPELPTPTATSKAVKPTANDCIVATDQDFQQLRQQITLAATEQRGLQIAQKAFAQKCYSVLQIRKISFLMLDENNKLALFKAAKTHLVDANNFGSLDSEFKSPSILQQFKAL